jgi:hypothetical protein
MYKDYEVKLNAILDKHKGVQKVELGLIDDLDKIFKDAQKLSSTAEGKGLADLRKVVLKVEGDFVKLLREASEGLDLIDKIEKSLKDLGLQKPKDIQGKENVLKSYEKNAEYWIKELNADQYR